MPNQTKQTRQTKPNQTKQIPNQTKQNKTKLITTDQNQNELKKHEQNISETILMPKHSKFTK